MVLNIDTEQIKETHFLSQVSRSYLSNLDLQKSKDGRKMPKMQMATFFGKSLLSASSRDRVEIILTQELF